MNIKETNSEGAKKFGGDKLDQIFGGQKELLVNYKSISEDHLGRILKNKDIKFSDEAWAGGEHNIHTKEGNFLIKDMIMCAIQELAEAAQVLKNWKPWKQTEIPSDAEHFREEMIDALHFFVEACILSGMTAEDVHDIYFRKHEVNKFRQESKY